MSSTDEQALIALLITAFLLSQKEIEAMTSAIIVARIASARASYARASDTAGVDGSDWEPSDDMQQEINDTSEQDAEGIAATYRDDLSIVVAGFVTSWLEGHDTLDGCEAAARHEIAMWATDRAAWKSEQIANYTGGSGANSGTNQWVDDLSDGEFDGVNPDDYEIEVQPAESSGDICKEYAGQRFALDDDIIEFPAHANCPHRKVVVPKE